MVKQNKRLMNEIHLLNCYKDGLIEAGCDEAGRGCLAGPVVAAAVILPNEFKNILINDSKQLTEKSRNFLRQIIEKESISWAVAFVDNHEIDKINILNASFLAMNNAIAQLEVKPQHLIIDGNRFKNTSNIPYTCIVKGDSKYLSIAAASILAKTHRDEYMLKIHQKHPEYNWEQNKAYPTKEHRKAIAKYGITSYHRKTYKLLENQLKLEF
jgi:ribonuclease HII